MNEETLPYYLGWRAGKKPVWPTFKGATLDQDAVRRISEGMGSKCIYLNVGTQLVRELPNGGIGRGGVPKEYATVSFDHRRFVFRLTDKRSVALYIIAWIGGYSKGSILHFGWQFPHFREYSEKDLELHSLSFYCEMARLTYGRREMPRDVIRLTSSSPTPHDIELAHL